MRLTILLLMACIIAPLGPLWAGESSSKAREVHVDIPHLIQQLGSNDFGDRETAMKALDSLGAAALDHLLAAKDSTDPEVSRRIVVLLARIQIRVDSTRLLEPKRIRLVYSALPLTKAVEDFSRRTGVTINLNGDAAKHEKQLITLDTGNVTFWEALDKFCQAAGLNENDPTALPESNDFSHYGRQMAFRRMWIDYDSRYSINASPLQLRDGKPKAMPCYYAGALRLRILPMDFPTGGQKPKLDEPDWTINLEITPEPRLGWRGLKSLRISKVIDDAGRELKTPLPYIGGDGENYNEFVQWGGGMGGYWNRAVDNQCGARYLPLRIPKAVRSTSTALKTVEGKVVGEVLSPVENLVTVSDIMKKVGEAVEGKHGESLKIVEASQTPEETIKIRIVVELPTRSHQGMVFMGGGFWPGGGQDAEEGNDYLAKIEKEVSLVDSKGRHLKLLSADANDQDNAEKHSKEMHLTYDFPAGSPAPAQLSYRGQRVMPVEVPFVLKDIPLPTPAPNK